MSPRRTGMPFTRISQPMERTAVHPKVNQRQEESFRHKLIVWSFPKVRATRQPKHSLTVPVLGVERCYLRRSACRLRARTNGGERATSTIGLRGLPMHV